MKAKRIAALFLAALVALTMVACGSSTAPAASAPAAESAEETTEETPAAELPETIVVGMMAGMEPYCYEAEDGTASGYDAAIIREVCSRLGVNVEFVLIPWESLLTSLDADKVQVVSSQLWRNPERNSKYAMARVPYFECGGMLLVGKDSDITSLETCGDAPFGTTVGDAWTDYAENYNKEHPDAPLNLQYYSEDISVVIADIANGRIAVTLNDPALMWRKVEAQNLTEVVKLTGDLVGSGCCYAAFQKSEKGEAIRDAFDAVYLEMINDGTTKKICEEWFGADYTENLLANVIPETEE